MTIVFGMPSGTNIQSFKLISRTSTSHTTIFGMADGMDIEAFLSLLVQWCERKELQIHIEEIVLFLPFHAFKRLTLKSLGDSTPSLHIDF